MKLGHAPTEAKILERLRQGYGSGNGDDYKEWIGFRDLSSLGNTSRLSSLVSGRRHTVFSGIEDDLFSTVERQPQTVNIQLQRAMEREITLACAQALGVDHPRYDNSDVLAVMSLDAVVERRSANGDSYIVAFDSKPSAELLDRRVLEKLSIHHLYCHYRCWRHHIVTEKTFPTHVRKNLAWIRAGARKELEVEVPAGLFSTYPSLMLDDLRARRRHLPLNQYGQWFERIHGLPLGIGMRVLQILAWRHQIQPDMDAMEIRLTSTRSLLDRKLAAAAPNP